jgi:UDP-N-acetylmuramoyl-tripeptide--D-alanyl-D-alanine ligase
MLTAAAEIIVEATHGELVAGSASAMANDVVIDSRFATPGCVFVAIKGESVDGHDYCEAALRRGARVLVVSRTVQEMEAVLGVAREVDAAVVYVSDTVQALQDLATYHRARLHCEVLGITGSTGKTTTKDFVDAVLGSRLSVVSTEGNRNNEIGLPLTVLRASVETDVLVVEMGMRGEGQIALLAAIARPTMGLVTNVGTSHIELLGSQDAIASAKSELVKSLPPDGAAFLNGDDAYSERLALASTAPVTYYGLSPVCAVTARDVEVDETSRPSFVLVTESGEACVSLPVPGRHNVYNALAAAAVGLRLEFTPEQIAAALGSVHVTDMRMQVFTAASGVTVINDAYNANPVSMRAAVETLAEMTGASRRIAVLGDMAELGSLTELAHFRLGEQVARLDLDVLVTVGPRAARIGDGALAETMPTECVRVCVTPAEAIEVLDDLLRPGDAVLVKGSRVMGLESVVEGIVSPR